jgi:hypothetical protein
MRTCVCPVGSFLTTIGTLTCPTSFGQVQKLIFQRAGGLSSAGLGTTTTGSTDTYSTWTTLAAATTNAKIVVTPFVAGFTPEPGGPREFGSGNEVRDGIPIIYGTNPTKVKVKVYEASKTIAANLKALECETIQVALVNENGQVAFDATNTGAVVGFDVQSYHVSDRILGGFDGPDYYEISFSMPGNWSSGWYVQTLLSGSMLDLVG